MKIWKKIVVVACLLALMVPAFGCKEEGPAEKAGREIDQAAEEAVDAAKKIFD